MPLLGKKIFVSAKPLVNRKSEELIYSIAHTKEQFRSKQDYEKRLALYKNRIWTCQSTGHTNLTHEEAWNSEKNVKKSVQSQFLACYEKPVLEIVHHSVQCLDTLVDQAWLKLQQVLSIDECISLKVKTSGKVVKAKVVRVDTCGISANPTSNCSSPSSDKENTDENSSNKDTGQKKWVPPKLLPYKYSIKLKIEEKIINCVPAADVTRVDRPPPKELLRLFIRTHALRAGVTSSSPWVVDEAMIKKHGIQNKLAHVFLSPMKIQDPAMVGCATKKRKLSANSSNSAKKPKLDKPKSSKSSGGNSGSSSKKKKDESDSNSKKKAKQGSTTTTTASTTSSAAKRKPSLSKNGGSPSKKSKLPKAVVISDSSSDSSEDCTLGKLKQKLPQADDDDVPLSALKNRTPTKSKKGDGQQSTPKKPKSAQKDQGKSSSKKKSSKNSEKKKSSKDSDKKKKGSSDKKKSSGSSSSSSSKSKDKESPKKNKGMKQMTLLEMSTKKGPKTPEKKKPSAASSPQKPPLLVRKLMAAMKTKDTNKNEYKKILEKVVIHLTAPQREKLPSEVKDIVLKAYQIHEEREKLKAMSPEEREKYLQKKREESKKKQAEDRRIRRAAVRKMKRELSKRYEDQDLDQKPLPDPKLVPQPEGLPVDAFGDVAMVTEFINCFSGLLMPQSEQIYYTDTLLKALADKENGKCYVAEILVILLQTLLQDEISEDYSELKTSLSDIPVNEFTASELVRLALRKNDTDACEEPQGDDASSGEGEQELEVNEELIEMLGEQEFNDLEPAEKLQILKGLCLRIMGTYSVQDFMEQKQAAASDLWRRKLLSLKNKKQESYKKAASKLSKAHDQWDSKENDPKNGNVKTEPTSIKASGLTITDFYGNKVAEEGAGGGEDEANFADDSLLSVLKRRQRRTAVIAKEREKRDKENRERREKEYAVFRRLREQEAFEKEFCDGINFAKIVLRSCPIGTDRNHNRYWLFSKCTPGLYVEKGWVNDTIGFSFRTDSSSDSSSSEFSSSDDEVLFSPQAPLYTKPIETSIPEAGQNIWYVYETEAEFQKLIANLHPQGVRESMLKNELLKRRDDIFRNIAAFEKDSNKETRKKSDEDESLEEGFKRELIETETRLRNGDLGGVSDPDEWEKRVEESSSIKEMASCMIDTQSSVIKRFLQGIMRKKKSRHGDSEKKEENPDSAVKEEVKEDTEPPGVLMWRESAKNCKTMSRLHVLLGILDACVKWEKSAENAKCKICRKKGEQVILCDDCNEGYHMYCLRPALPIIPEGDWYCPSCLPQSKRRSRRNSRKKYGNDEGDSEDSDNVHFENCVVCDGQDELIKCSRCPDVYHIECHDPPLRYPPRGQWLCTLCKNGRRFKTRLTLAKRQKAQSMLRRQKAIKEFEQEQEDEEEGEEEESEEEVVAKNSKSKRKVQPRKYSKRKSKSKKSYKEGSEDSDDDDDDDNEDDDEEENEEGEEEEEEDNGDEEEEGEEEEVEEEGEEEEEAEEQEEGLNSDEEYVTAVVTQFKEEEKSKTRGQTSQQAGSGRRQSRQMTTQTSTTATEPYPSRSRRRTVEMSICEAILIRMIMNKDSWPFRFPVDEQLIPDYYELIANPIDLRTIKHKIYGCEYRCVETFIEDVSLLFRNCAIYNAVQSEVYQCMIVLEKQFMNLMSKFLPQYPYSRKKPSNGFTDHNYTCYGTKKRGHCI
ncbi:tyrosine-protein kinase BAZ1B-like isoform X2 [Argonauta hians]